jgi:aspartokinase
VPLPQITYEAALRMAAEGCDLVQARALAAAARTNTRLVIRALADGGPQTLVADDMDCAAAPVRRAI